MNFWPLMLMSALIRCWIQHGNCSADISRVELGIKQDIVDEFGHDIK